MLPLEAPEDAALDTACTPTGPELCFNAIDDNCNGVIDEGCGVQTGLLQFAIAWSEEAADVLEEFTVCDRGFLFDAEGDGLDKTGDFRVIVDAEREAALEERASVAGPRDERAIGFIRSKYPYRHHRRRCGFDAGEPGGGVELGGVAWKGDGGDAGREGDLIAPDGGGAGPVHLDGEADVVGAVGIR